MEIIYRVTLEDVSFSKATEHINSFLHHDKDNALRVKTVEEFVERMGCKISASYKASSDAILSKYGIDTEDGIVSENSAIPQEARAPKLPETTDGRRIEEVAIQYNKGREKRESIDVDNITILPEASVDDCVYIYVDDVLVKHQKECRSPGRCSAG